MAADIGGKANEDRYTGVLRDWFDANGGVRAAVDWQHLRDRKGTSSIDDLILASAARAGKSRRRSIAARQSAIRRAAHVRIAQNRAASGQTGVLPASKPARPIIAGTKVSQHLELAKQWHPTKNGTVRPEDVPAGTPRKYWWLCDRRPDHEWEAQVGSRALGARCPFCTGRRVAASDSLAVHFPELAAEWHLGRNTKRPEECSYGSDAEVWWQCPRFAVHVYRARVSSRTMSATGCPSCATGGRPKKVPTGQKRAKVVQLDAKRPKRPERQTETEAPPETG